LKSAFVANFVKHFMEKFYTYNVMTTVLNLFIEIKYLLYTYS